MGLTRAELFNRHNYAMPVFPYPDFVSSCNQSFIIPPQASLEFANAWNKRTSVSSAKTPSTPPGSPSDSGNESSPSSIGSGLEVSSAFMPPGQNLPFSPPQKEVEIKNELSGEKTPPKTPIESSTEPSLSKMSLELRHTSMLIAQTLRSPVKFEDDQVSTMPIPGTNPAGSSDDDSSDSFTTQISVGSEPKVCAAPVPIEAAPYSPEHKPKLEGTRNEFKANTSYISYKTNKEPGAVWRPYDY